MSSGWLVGAGHVLVLGPLLIYLGLFDSKPKWVYNTVLALGILGTIFFAWLVIFKRERYWMIVHLLVFAPLLIYYGWFGEKAHWFAGSLLIAIGCAAIGYHIVKKLKKR